MKIVKNGTPITILDTRYLLLDGSNETSWTPAGNLIYGLNAEFISGYTWDSFSLNDHNHDTLYLRLDGTNDPITVGLVFDQTSTSNRQCLILGANSPTADKTAVIFTQNITGVFSGHSLRDESLITCIGGSSYATFDSVFTFSGSGVYDHMASFQSRPIYNGSGSLSSSWGCRYQFYHSGSGTVTNAVGYKMLDASKTSSGGITTQVAFWCDELTSGTTNYCLYSPGSTQSYHYGYFRIVNGAQVDNQLLTGTLGVGLSAPTTEIFKVNLSTSTLAQAASILMTQTGAISGNVLQFVGALSNNGAVSGVTTYNGINGTLTINATTNNSYIRYIYGIFGRVGWSANSPYTAGSIGGYGIYAEVPYVAGAGTISIGEVVGVQVANQGNAKWSSSYGLRISAQSGSTNSYGIFVNAGTSIFNEDGVSTTNFRIESDTNTYMFYVDSANNALQIGTTSAGVIADFRSTAIVFNEDGSDRDFRVESDTDTNLLFTDASTNRVGIGDNEPGEKLDVAGNINVTGVYKVDDVQVVSNRVIDARIDDVINDTTWDSTTAGVLDAIRDALISHGLMAAS